MLVQVAVALRNKRNDSSEDALLLSHNKKIPSFLTKYYPLIDSFAGILY